MPDNFDRLTQQIAAKIESTKGSVEALSAAEVDFKPFLDISFTPEFDRFAIETVGEDKGQDADIPAGKKARIGFGTVFRGSGVLGTAPAIGPYLQACGMQYGAVKTISLTGAPSGGNAKFEVGEAWTATGGKAGFVAEDAASTTFRFIQTTGAALDDTDVITVAGDSDSATASGSSSAYAEMYRPLSSGEPTLTIQSGIKNSEATSGQDFLKRLRGAMGTGTIDLNALDALRCTFDFLGVLDFAGAGSLFTGVTYEHVSNANVPKLINAQIDLDGFEMRPNAVQLDLGVNVEMDPDPSTGGGTEGYIHAHISNREPKLIIDPYRLKPGDFDDIGKLGDGSEFKVAIGAGTSPHRMEVRARKGQIREDSIGERSGKETMGLTIHLNRDPVGADWDYEIWFL